MIDRAVERLGALIERVARLRAADDWAMEINPTQAAALSYLSRANRFSRSPSQVADYLATTRGTVSQTLRALERKGLIAQEAGLPDRRRLGYAITEAGAAVLTRGSGVEAALAALSPPARAALEDALSDLLRRLLRQRGGRSFGLCATCRHHRRDGDAASCALLNVPLSPHDATLICHEHAPRDAA